MKKECKEWKECKEIRRNKKMDICESGTALVYCGDILQNIGGILDFLVMR